VHRVNIDVAGRILAARGRRAYIQSACAIAGWSKFR
jgi:hypothetical protein